MVYRIHFTAQDLARTRVAEAPMPLFELDLATRALQDRSWPVRLDGWRRRARAQLSAQARMALSLIPPVGWSVGLISSAQSNSPEELVEEVYGARRGDFNAQLSFVAERQSIPSWARHLADDTALYRQFVDGLGSLYSALLGPYKSQLDDLLMADRTVRMHQFLGGGIERILALANPQWMRWNPPVLEIRMANGAEYDLYLEGQASC